MTDTEFRREGWRSIEAGELPRATRLVEFAREPAVRQQSSWFGCWADLPPDFDVAGLWWRLVE
jgi:hypothetical protein